MQCDTTVPAMEANSIETRESVPRSKENMSEGSGQTEILNYYRNIRQESGCKITEFAQNNWSIPINPNLLKIRIRL
jgi:hypothetical protein